MILVDHLHRHEALAGVGHRDRHRPGIEVEYGGRVERVAVEADDGLVVDRRRLAAMEELAEAAILDDVAHVEIGLRADEVVDGDGIRAPACAAGWSSANAVKPADVSRAVAHASAKQLLILTPQSLRYWRRVICTALVCFLHAVAFSKSRRALLPSASTDASP